jgi:predicted MFS family arabinose efflux permease
MLAVAIANTIRGTGWAALNTAGCTAVGHVALPGRRAEASSYYSVATSLATTFSPALALWLIAAPYESYSSVFGLSALAALLAAATSRLVLPPANRASPATRTGSPGLRLGAFVDRGVLLASVLLIALTTTNAAAISFLPLYARSIGIENPGIYFVFSGSVSILLRVAIGRYLDRGSRGLWIVGAFALLATGMGVLRSAPDLTVLVAGGMIYSVGNSLASTMLLALALDLADPQRPGAGMATYSGSYQVGHGLGAPLAGALIQFAGFDGMWIGAIVCALFGIGLTVANWRGLARAARPEPVPTASVG